MFHAMRQWWAGGSGKVTARLFLFEFVVVVLGVLVAQAVAEWAGRRSDVAAMERAKVRLDRDVRIGRATVEAWLIAMPCLDSQLDAVMRVAGGDARIDPAILKRPAFRSMKIEPLTSESGLLLIDRYGADKAQLYSTLQDRSERITVLANQAAERWMALIVLDPGFGRVREGDRVNARAAASEIKSSLLSLAISGRGFLDESRRLGLATKVDQGRRLPRGCTDIRTSGALMPYVDGWRP